MADQLETIVQRMIDAGEPEENIASVVREFRQTSEPSLPVTPAVGAGLGAMTAAPAILSGVNTVANVARMMPMRRTVPLVAGVLAAKDLAGGRYKEAAMEGATAAAPAILTGVARATGQAGPLATAAKTVSRGAGLLSIPAIIASLLYDAKQQVDQEHAQGQVFDLQREARNARPFEQ